MATLTRICLLTKFVGLVAGNAVRLIEAFVETITGAALPGASFLRRTVSRIVTLPARLLSRFFA